MKAEEIKKYCDSNGIINALKLYGRDASIHLPMYEDFVQFPIEELNLSVRSFNALKRAHVSTVQDLCNIIMSSSGLEGIRNLGKTSIKEIKTELLTQGYEKLSDDLRMSFWEKLIERNIDT